LLDDRHQRALGQRDLLPLILNLRGGVGLTGFLEQIGAEIAAVGGEVIFLAARRDGER
jgi:hypothetical protein